MNLITILFLYLAFRVKQVLCDFFLQSSWMALTKAKPLNEGGAGALCLHAGIHAVATLVVMLMFAPPFWWLAIVDFFIHFSIDKIKAIITTKMNWTYKDNSYWWAFGIDQEAHNLTHLAYIILLVMSSGASLH